MRRINISKKLIETEDFIVVVDDKSFIDYESIYILPKFLGNVYSVPICELSYCIKYPDDRYDFQLKDSMVSKLSHIVYYDFLVNDYNDTKAIQVISGKDYKSFMTLFQTPGIDNQHSMIITKDLNSNCVTIQDMVIHAPLYGVDGWCNIYNYVGVEPMKI